MKILLLGFVLLTSIPSFAKFSRYDCESVKYGTKVKVSVDSKGSRGSINDGGFYNTVYIEDIGFVPSKSGDMGYITKSGDSELNFQILECEVIHK